MTKPQDTSVKPKPPRERLSLPLTPQLTKAVQALGKAFGRPQAEVLGDLLRLAVPGLALNLEALHGTYAAAQREALAGVLGLVPQEAPLGMNDPEDGERGLYGENGP